MPTRRSTRTPVEFVEEQPAAREGAASAKDRTRSTPKVRRLKVVRMKQRDPNVIADQLNKHLGHYERDNRQRAAPSVLVGKLTIGLEFDKVHPRAGVIGATNQPGRAHSDGQIPEGD